jgi:hypothetical protein
MIRSRLSVALGAAATACACALPSALAQDSEAKAAFKTMSDFLAAQPSLSVSYDATLEIVTAGLMKVDLASSGSMSLARPDRIRMTRNAGIADVELVYDGTTLAAYGRKLNVYGKLTLIGTIDDLVATLRDEFGLELPAADLLSTAPYDSMMENVTEARALGEGMIRGQMCDHLAFRTADVDWQIWLAQGGKPFPCRFTITSKMTVLAPSYSIDFTGWKTGTEVSADDFQLKPAPGARHVNMTDLTGLDDVPPPDVEGDAP